MSFEVDDFNNRSCSGDRVFFCPHQGCMDNVGSWLFTNYAIILGICLGVAVIEVCCMSSGRHEQYVFVMFIINDVFLGYIVQWNVTWQFSVEHFRFDLSSFFPTYSFLVWYFLWAFARVYTKKTTPKCQSTEEETRTLAHKCIQPFLIYLEQQISLFFYSIFSVSKS